MALEAVVFPPDIFGYNGKELHSLLGEGGVYGFEFSGLEEMSGSVEGWSQVGVHGNCDFPCSSLVHKFEEFDVNTSSPETGIATCPEEEMAAGRRKRRRRMKRCKNKEEVENQRMTHIAVERNRRKQMNDYLAVLRSLMPAAYVQRGDQASIIGGAINFVKELEHLLQSLESQKQIMQQPNASSSTSSPFAGFFSFPQYSTCSGATAANGTNTNSNEGEAEIQPAMADIEVTMVESHANLKVLLKRRPKQLLKMVVELQSFRLTTLHLNITTVDQMVLYSFSLKVEDDCRLTSVDDIATAVYQMVLRIQDEAAVI